MGLKFGRFGREDGVLILVTQGGHLVVKILKRTVTFEAKEPKPGGASTALHHKISTKEPYSTIQYAFLRRLVRLGGWVGEKEANWLLESLFTYYFVCTNNAVSVRCLQALPDHSK